MSLSRNEYNDIHPLSQWDEDPTQSSQFNQTNCSYCNEARCNTVGIISPLHKTWYCSGACQTMYMYDNKLAQYGSETVAVIHEMRKKFYSDEKKTKRKHH